jgi:hypothetical protein
VPRIPRAVQKYLDTARKYGPDQVLETAEEDEDLTDDEYNDLWYRMEAWNKKWKWNEKTRKWEEKKPPKPVICEGCGKEIPPEQMNEGGRKRRFHNNGNVCKQLAYRKRRAKARLNS